MKVFRQVRIVLKNKTGDNEPDKGETPIIEWIIQDSLKKILGDQQSTF